MQASDWNAVKFGDDCIVNGFLQYHTFENMMLKVKLTDIRDGSTVNFGATVMGGAVIEPEYYPVAVKPGPERDASANSHLRRAAPWNHAVVAICPQKLTHRT